MYVLYIMLDLIFNAVKLKMGTFCNKTSEFLSKSTWNVILMCKIDQKMLLLISYFLLMHLVDFIIKGIICNIFIFWAWVYLVHDSNILVSWIRGKL